MDQPARTGRSTDSWPRIACTSAAYCGTVWPWVTFSERPCPRRSGMMTRCVAAKCGHAVLQRARQHLVPADFDGVTDGLLRRLPALADALGRAVDDPGQGQVRVDVRARGPVLEAGVLGRIRAVHHPDGGRVVVR